MAETNTKGPARRLDVRTGGQHKTSLKGRMRLLAIMSTTLLLAIALAPIGAAQEAGSVTRALPDSVDCTNGDSFTVTLTVSPPSGTSSWIVDESPDGNVSVQEVDSNNNGEYIADQHQVKWLSLQGGAAVHTYVVTVPAGTSEETQLVFAGEYRFNPSMDERAAIQGDTTVECAPPCAGGPDGTHHPYDADRSGVFTDDDLFTLIDDWRASGGDTLDNLLFAGIDAWKLHPGSYC